MTPQFIQHKLRLGNLENGLTYLRNIPTEQLYRLYVDGSKLKEEQGPMAYDKRREYHDEVIRNENEILKALQSLLAPIQHGIGQREKALEIPNELLKKIHFRLIHKNDAHYDLMCAGCMEGASGFNISRQNLSKDGLIQLLKRSADPLETAYRYSLDLDSRTLYINNKNECLNLSYTAEQQHTFYTLIYEKDGYFQTSNNDDENDYEHIIEEYTKNFIQRFEVVRNEGNVDEVIRTIVDYVQRCEQLHPFPDGNSRTFVNTLMCYCLMQAGLPPVIFDKPAVVDGHSIDEITAIVKEGCINTLRLIDGEDGFHGFSHKEMMELKKEDPHLKNIIMQSYDIKASLDELLEPILGKNTLPVREERVVEIDQYKREALVQEIRSLSTILVTASALSLTGEESTMAEKIRSETTDLESASIADLFEKKMSLYAALDAVIKKCMDQVKMSLQDSSIQIDQKNNLDSCLCYLQHFKFSFEDRLLLGKHNHAEEKYFTDLTKHIEDVIPELKQVITESECQKIRMRLKKLTDTYLNELNPQCKNYNLVNELKNTLEGKDDSAFNCIDKFYQKLNEKDNLQSLKSDKTRSSAQFILGISIIATTIITGIFPGILVMWATKKWPTELFVTHAATFVKKVDMEFGFFKSSHEPKNSEENLQEKENTSDLAPKRHV